MIFFKPNPRKEIEKIEKNVDLIKSFIFQKNADVLECEEMEKIRNDFYEMEKKYLRLKERYKYDIKTLLIIALDWIDYVRALNGLISAELQLSIGLEDDTAEEYAESIKEPRIIKEEIEKRFNELLEKNSNDRKKLNKLTK